VQERHPIKYLAPAWFAVIMGTGGLANILYLWQTIFHLGNLLGIVLAVRFDSLDNPLDQLF
jgi:tellurite resistance protein TehA-like permease